MPNNDYILRSDALKAILGVSIYDTIEELEGARTIAENTWADGLYDAYKIIEEEVDAADVEPKRKTGYWLSHYDDEGHRFGYICSECGVWYVFDDLNGAHYCMNCGAKMDAEPPKEKTMRIEDIIERKIAEAEQSVTKLIKKEVEEQIKHDMIGARIYYEDREAGEAWLRMHMNPKEEDGVKL